MANESTKTTQTSVWMAQHSVVVHNIVLVLQLSHAECSVADPEGDPRVPWIPPFIQKLACRTRTQSNLPELQQLLSA